MRRGACSGILGGPQPSESTILSSVMPSTSVRAISSRRDLRRFVQFPSDLYADDPLWIAPLRQEIRGRLSARNPYFEHAQAAYFLAEREGRVVGRITAQVCELARKHHGADTGHFGFFECEDSPKTAEQLFRAAEEWLSQKGMNRVLGPFSLSINEEIGVLVDGFHRPPSLLMGHHLPYYDTLITGAGYEKEMDAYAYYMDITGPYPRLARRVLDRAESNPRLDVRCIKKGNFKREMRRALDLFREAWVDNWGYVPPTEAEIDRITQDLSLIIGRGTVMFATVDGETAGFMVVLPNINEFLGDLDGRLFPTGWLRLLCRIKWAHFDTVRVPLLGIRKQHQSNSTGAALTMLLIARCREIFLSQGVTHCEMSWVLENNGPMQAVLGMADMPADKTYRVYAKSL